MKKDVEPVVNALIDCITEELAGKGKITMVGFGTFKTLARKERSGINPKSLKKIQIPACTVPKFTPGKELKEKVK
jgi:DNA-binding protein HU-beta